MKVKDSLAGSRGLCPFCHQPIEVPRPTITVSAARIQKASLSKIEKAPSLAAAPTTTKTDSLSEKQTAPSVASESYSNPFSTTHFEPIDSVQKQTPPAPPAPAFDIKESISLWIAAVGLGLLCLCPFFRWVAIGAAGGVTGLVGDGRILIAVSAVAIVLYVVALTVKWQTNLLLLVVELWGIFVAIWMFSLFQQVATAVKDTDNAFAQILSNVLIGPGTGLYVGLIGGAAVAASLAFFTFSRAIGAQRIKGFAILQGIGIIVVASAGLFFTRNRLDAPREPGPPPRLDFGNSVAPKPEEKKEFEATLGQEFQLGNLKITPLRFDETTLDEKPTFGDLRPRDVKSMVLTISVRNTSGGQVFTPYSSMEVTDNFGNVCPDPTHSEAFASRVWIKGNEMFEDLRPGKTATVKVAFDPQVDNASEYTCKFTAQTSNKKKFDHWQMKFRPDKARTNSQTK
jgi:hypothetical protein